MAETEDRQRLAVGVAGTGALGRHHVRLLGELDRVELIGLYDASEETARAVAAEFATTAFPTLEALAERVNAMVVAVPTIHHEIVGRNLLERGVHVLIEKPIASTLAEADRLISAAGDLCLAVGHVEFFNPAVQSLLALGGGQPRFVQVERLSVFTQRSLDIDVVLDLMIHDLQIVHALDPSPVREIRAIGIDVLSPRIDIADVRLELESGCVVNLTASRVSAERVRQLRVFFVDRYCSLDYHAQTLKGAQLADPGEGEGGRKILAGEVPVHQAEPLRRELEAFVDRCLGGDSAIVDGSAARRALGTAMAVVEAINERRQ